MAPDEAVAGVECVCPAKRKAEAFAGEECSRAAKRLDCSEGDKDAPAGTVQRKKMWRLPLEEIKWILAQPNEPVWAEIRELKRANPSLLPSPEEEKDEAMVLLYACARDCYEDEEKFARFQAWVRSEYASMGFVEVDYDYFGERAEATRLSKEAREEVFRDTDLSSDSEDDDELKHLKRTVRSWV
ncbi:hypothetical protein CFC21_076397 [Triticum aestivum]|uniref:Uncharacterized protein n=4 Tax=Triticinae TaxID=1648030 RepID=A0A453JYZ8_AEGTS|nr:uncharacterized protein LOC109743777 [Aegilops tauschii subsp. strangulata]KAF7070973.1 hypothetical protein CFC21_076397 [Triticum aestivum]